MNSIYFTSALTASALLLSFMRDRKKTLAALIKAWKMFSSLLPPLMSILIIISVTLALTPEKVLLELLGSESGFKGMAVAAIIGSVSLIPGFIAYPVSKILISNGVQYSVIAVFITTLMMVGIITIPVEKKYFGLRAALLRNFISLISALIVGLLISFIWRMI
ncbi:MAG: permease [Spirochaetes bacterium]|nr:permease [Spirochaetota bacterium]